MDQYTGSQLDAAPALTLSEQITLAFHIFESRLPSSNTENFRLSISSITVATNRPSLLFEGRCDHNEPRWRGVTCDEELVEMVH